MKKTILLILFLTIVIPNATYALWFDKNGTGELISLKIIGTIHKKITRPGIYRIILIINYKRVETTVELKAGQDILVIEDPPAATFYSGRFTLHYDNNLMKVVDSGWLGPWGIDKSSPVPSADPNLWEDGDTVELQQPNPNLTASTVNDTTNGLLTTTFDWGISGHSTDSTEPFNFFASAFEFTKDVKVTYLGDFDQAPPGANLFVSTDNADEGVYCTLPDSTTLQKCGEPTTSYYKVEFDPDPSLVTLIDSSFTANANNGAVTIVWETANEIDNAGFFVWRGQLKAGKAECSLNVEDYTEVKQLNSILVPAKGDGSLYSYEDQDVTSGNTYCYVLEDVELDGKRYDDKSHLSDPILASMP